MTTQQLAALEAKAEAEYRAEQVAQMARAMKEVNELSKSMDIPTGRNYPAWNARKIEAAAKRRMNSKPESR